MKSFTFFSFTFLILMAISCEDSREQNNKYGNHQIEEGIPIQSQNQNIKNDQDQIAKGEKAEGTSSQRNNDAEIIMQTVMNSKTGEPSMYIPYPSNWKFIKGASFGEPALKGPNDLTLTFYQPQLYFYTNNSSMNNAYQSGGVQVMAPVGIESVVNQQIIPQCKQMGMTLLNQYSMPDVAAKDKEYAKKLLGSSPQDVFYTIGTEWKDKQGNKALVLLHYFEMISDASINWGYNTEMLKVQEASFNQSKEHYIYGAVKRVFNQNEINALNNELAGKLKEQNDHAAAMRNIYSKGSKERLANDAATNEYIRNNNKATYENKAHNNDVVQQQTNNALNDVNVVVSPFDGKEFQVESGHKTYWINNEGKYIKSDDPLFDPNKYETQPGVWQKAPKKVFN